MQHYMFSSFAAAIEQARLRLLYKSDIVHSARWQGSDIANRPEMATHEVTHATFGVDLDTGRHPYVTEAFIEALARDIKPNLPWADDHFAERVSGAPMNPGTEWANWPYGKSAATFLDERGKFNHNYMERYWPKHAGRPKEATATPEEWEREFTVEQQARPDQVLPNTGINHMIYGDLTDVVTLLASDPYTRQAYLPIWFPEDTGGGSKRAPCTIGYHFLMRDGKLDINYHIRSCDFVRHFRDDLYLTARLLAWVIERCADLDVRWQTVRPGRFLMTIGSLHVFRNDFPLLNQGQ